jgi:hypothetical protein
MLGDKPGTMCRADFRLPCRDGVRHSGNALNGTGTNSLNELSGMIQMREKILTQRRKW